MSALHAAQTLASSPAAALDALPQPEAANGSEAQDVIAGTDLTAAAEVQQEVPVHHPGDHLQGFIAFRV